VDFDVLRGLDAQLLPQVRHVSILARSTRWSERV